MGGGNTEAAWWRNQDSRCTECREQNRADRGCRSIGAGGTKSSTRTLAGFGPAGRLWTRWDPSDRAREPTPGLRQRSRHRRHLRLPRGGDAGRRGFADRRLTGRQHPGPRPVRHRRELKPCSTHRRRSRLPTMPAWNSTGSATARPPTSATQSASTTHHGENPAQGPAQRHALRQTRKRGHRRNHQPPRPALAVPPLTDPVCNPPWKCSDL